MIFTATIIGIIIFLLIVVPIILYFTLRKPTPKVVQSQQKPVILQGPIIVPQNGSTPVIQDSHPGQPQSQQIIVTAQGGQQQGITIHTPSGQPILIPAINASGQKQDIIVGSGTTLYQVGQGQDFGGVPRYIVPVQQEGQPIQHAYLSWTPEGEPITKPFTEAEEDSVKKEAELQAKLKAQKELEIAQAKAKQAKMEADLEAERARQLKAQEMAKLQAERDEAARLSQAQTERAQMLAQQAQMLAIQQAQQQALLKAQQDAALKAQQDAALKAQQDAVVLKAQQDAAALKAQQAATLKAQQDAAALKAQQSQQSQQTTGTPQSEIDIWLREHNRVRENVGFPKNSVIWNEELVTGVPGITPGAKDWANNCFFEHAIYILDKDGKKVPIIDPKTGKQKQNSFGNLMFQMRSPSPQMANGQKIGENLVYVGSTTSSDAATDKQFKLWEDEGKVYNYETGTGQGVGHYTQIVDKTLKEIGCYCSDCSKTLGGRFCVCRYNPAGNMWGVKPFTCPPDRPYFSNKDIMCKPTQD